MFNEEMYNLGSKRSVIRELFEYGKQRAAEVGEDKVYDFSLGNPNVPVPEKVTDTILRLVSSGDSSTVHGYTSAQGDFSVRRAVATSIASRFGASVSANDIYMTCGAAAALSIVLRALNESNDEFVIFAPYFPEYKVFINSAGGIPVTVPFTEKDFRVDFDAFEKAVTSNTKAVIINSPNNPSGVVYSENTVLMIAEILERKCAEFKKPIYIISDEPYRELVYDGVQVPYIMNYYKNTIVCYSYSKSLSLPGERIGYVAVSPQCEGANELYSSVCGAGRALGYVCAPSLFQKIIEECVDVKPDIDAYKLNRDVIYERLTEIGYECVHPDGAFYLFVKSLEPDAGSFADKAKTYGLLLVPGDDFAAKGYVRIAYCVSYDMIVRSLPAFKQLYDCYNKKA